MNPLTRFNKLRNFTRKLGINPLLHKLIYWNNSYEEKFDKLFSSKLEPGYIIYDIGANMGNYSIIYSKIVGRNGKVIAFEPSIKL